MNRKDTWKAYNEAELLLTDQAFHSSKSPRRSKRLREILRYSDPAEGERQMPGQVAPWMQMLPVLLATLCIPTPVLADDLTLMADLEYRRSDVGSTDEQDEGEFSRFSELFDLNLRKQIYPYLELHAGGLFDLRDERTSSGGSRLNRKDRTRQYFGALNLTNPLYKAGATYRRSQDKTSGTNLVPRRILRDQYIASLTWRPAGLPLMNMNYTRSHAFDTPETRDSISELLTLRSRYDYREAAFDYTYTRNDNQERLADSGSLSQIHNAGIHYSTRFLDDRISVTAGSRLSYSTLLPTDAGIIWRPTILRGTEFWMLNDSDPNENASGDFTTVDPADDSTSLTNVNIGGDAPQEPVSVGLDFGSPTEVDTIHVLPLEDDDNDDLARPEDIDAASNSFSWQVYTSDDQENWTQCVPTANCFVEAEYNLFDNRFEISFTPGASTRYIKVWTLPSSQQGLGKVLVANVQAFTTISGSAGVTFTDLDQNYSIGLRWAITDRTSTSYDAYYKVLTSDPSGRRRSTLTNGMSLQHVFSPIFVGNARFLRSDGRATGRDDRTHHSYVVSIRGDYLETLSQTLVYSGTHTKDEDGTSTVNSIFLRNSADLYRDWSANLDLGQSWNNPGAGAKTRSTVARIRTNLAPNRMMNLRLDYSVAWIAEEGEASRLEQIGSAQAFFVPFKTLSLFAAVRFKNRDQRNRDSTISQDYSLNWAPFPGGSMNFSLSYTQSKTTQGLEERVITPELRWQIARGILLTLKYSTGPVESTTERHDIDTFTGNLRVFY